MTEDIRRAFAHPEERAGPATSGPVPDRISLRDHIALADIGAFQQERGHPQRLRFNVVVELLPQPAVADSDDVDAILSYDRIAEAIAAELAAERLNLLETLAEAAPLFLQGAERLRVTGAETPAVGAGEPVHVAVPTTIPGPQPSR